MAEYFRISLKQTGFWTSSRLTTFLALTMHTETSVTKFSIAVTLPSNETSKNTYGKNCGRAVMVICATFHCKRYTLSKRCFAYVFPHEKRFPLSGASKPRNLLRSKQRLTDLRDKTLAVRQKREAVGHGDAKREMTWIYPPTQDGSQHQHDITFLVSGIPT